MPVSSTGRWIVPRLLWQSRPLFSARPCCWFPSSGASSCLTWMKARCGCGRPCLIPFLSRKPAALLLKSATFSCLIRRSPWWARSWDVPTTAPIPPDFSIVNSTLASSLTKTRPGPARSARKNSSSNRSTGNSRPFRGLFSTIRSPRKMLWTKPSPASRVLWRSRYTGRT